MDKKLIFFDIDGTLMDHHGVIQESTRRALDEIKKSGHQVFLATGRSRFEVPRYVFDLGCDGLVLGDGTDVEYQGKEIFHATMNSKQIALGELIACFEADGAHLYCGGRDRAFISQASKPFFDKRLAALLEHDRHWSEMTKGIFVVADLKSITEQNIEKVIYNNFYGDLASVKERFAMDFSIWPSSLTNRMDDSVGEVHVYGVNKATGIQVILDYLGKAREDVISFGDNYNDIEMTKFANVGVAMGNGVPALKEVADVITAPIDEDGIYKGLQTLGLLGGGAW